MALSDEAREARNRYYRELYAKRKKTREGRKIIDQTQETYWLKKAAEYAKADAAAAAKAARGK